MFWAFLPPNLCFWSENKVFLVIESSLNFLSGKNNSKKICMSWSTNMDVGIIFHKLWQLNSLVLSRDINSHKIGIEIVFLPNSSALSYIDLCWLIFWLDGNKQCWPAVMLEVFPFWTKILPQVGSTRTFWSSLHL